MRAFTVGAAAFSAIVARVYAFCDSLAFEGDDGPYDPINRPFTHGHTENGSKPLRFRKGNEPNDSFQVGFVGVTLV